MKLIESNVREIQPTGYELKDILHSVASAAKICYRTEQTSLTDEQFVRMLINKGHYRTLEMGTVYLKTTIHDGSWDYRLAGILDNHWTRETSAYSSERDDDSYITTNLRVVLEDYLTNDETNGGETPDEILRSDYWLWQYLCEPTDHHKLRHTYEFTCSRGAGDDFRTHVAFSAVMESTRYCNYFREKFGSQIAFIEPYWNYTNEDIEDFEQIERIYMKKVSQGYQPQQAKNFLGLGVATKLRMCGYDEDWFHFVRTRDTEAAYPECRMLAHDLYELLTSTHL